MRRQLLRSWLYLGYHVDGMDFDRYLALPLSARHELHEELSDMIDRASDEGGPSDRPKQWRRGV